MLTLIHRIVRIGALLPILSLTLLSQQPSVAKQKWPPATKKKVENLQAQRAAGRKPIKRDFDDLWRTYVINATNATILGMVLDGKDVWLSSGYGRSCTQQPPDPCVD